MLIQWSDITLHYLTFIKYWLKYFVT